MRHVTFVHGIGNKPDQAHLLALWKEALLGNGGIDLDAAGVSSSMVYWADVLHAEPLIMAAPDEDLGDADEDAAQFADSPMPMPGSLREAEFTVMVAAKVGAAMVASRLGVSSVEATSFREARLTGFLSKLLMRALLRDAHHYLYDVEHEPRAGERYRVRQEIRKRFVRALAAAPLGARHLVVGHSLGSVIAYDCLKNVPNCPVVDGFVTLGSPLGLSEVQERLEPGYSREEGFPTEKLQGDWRNLADRLDPVCGLDVALGGDFRAGGERRVIDRTVDNRSSRHGIGRYLAQERVREAIRTGLGL